MSDAPVAKFVHAGGSQNGSGSASHSHEHGGREHSHDGHGHDGHGHTHEQMEHPGRFAEREQRQRSGRRDFVERAYTVGIGGPVGAGKTALTLALCKKLRERISVCVVTNDIFTREDAEFLLRNQALLDPDRISAVETGGCPHAAVREDITANVVATEALTSRFAPVDLVFIESGGDNLAANFSRELADYIIYVIDVAGGDKVPRKGGPGVTQSDLLVINKTDLAEAVGASLDVMARDAAKMRGDGPTVFAQCKHDVGVDEIVDHILKDRAAVAEHR
mmetsp:Transcript_23661/g.57782  ORF Transcript_23661/g.57782 Transcript_23661/m.57782 type:complete len:277 (+) Transcript_23661:90-920(+)